VVRGPHGVFDARVVVATIITIILFIDGVYISDTTYTFTAVCVLSEAASEINN